MMRSCVGLIAVLALSACAADNIYASDAAVAQARHVAGGPSSVTLFTAISTRNGAGAHSGLLINGSERVMFDPAGTWYHPALPERHDVHYGVTDKMVLFYADYHARETFNMLEQTVEVTPAQADAIIARAEAYGAVQKAHCAVSVSSILRGVPGFESFGATYSPKKVSANFAALPGATSRLITDDDADDNHGVLLVQVGDAALTEGAN